MISPRGLGIEGEMIKSAIRRFVVYPLSDMFQKTAAKPYILIALVFTLMLERLLPADKKQKNATLDAQRTIFWSRLHHEMRAFNKQKLIKRIRELRESGEIEEIPI